MDVSKLLKNINNVNQYITVSHDSLEQCKTSRIPLNMTTVLSLNKIRSLEIEYFNKCEENGIACAIIERMLALPPSKTWGVLGKELVILLQFWLEAILRHFTNKFRFWWKFLNLLLKYLREIRLKDQSLPNILVEHTAECLLELATRHQFNDMQRQEILYCLNMFCSESSREIRFALRNRFGSHFVKLALSMAACGYLPCQYSVLETLLRWLLPRQQPMLRQAEAEKWFPKEFFSPTVADIFVERTWKNFFRDARDLLNTHNEAGDLIASVLCRSLTVGKLGIIPGGQSQEAWLDINVPTRCMTILLDPRLLESVGVVNHRTFETLLISEDNTKAAKLYRNVEELTISVSTRRSPQILPADIQLTDGGDVTIAVTSRGHLPRLDHALRSVFGDKYQVLLDVEKDLRESTVKEQEHSVTSQSHPEDPRFSHPAELKPRLRSGYMVRQGPRSGCRSPSTASTSSLAQLREKLTALPSFRYDKTVNSVCALPDLSVVTERSESDTHSSFISFLRRPHGVISRNNNSLKPVKSPIRQSQSDGESYQRIEQSRHLSPVAPDNNSPSCLLAATIGTEGSVINDTVEELSKVNIDADNIVDLLAKEFLQAETKKRGDILDSGIGVEDKKNENSSGNTEAIEHTPFADVFKSSKQKYKFKKVSSTDESNTECSNETHSYVSIRTKPRVKTVDGVAKPVIDEKIVETFFSQNFAENRAGDIAISPSLAKKINETSSETSDGLEENNILINEGPKEDIEMYTFNEIDVIECLNSMVDKVCDEFDKCTEYLSRDDVLNDEIEKCVLENAPLKNIVNTIQNNESKKNAAAAIKPEPKSKNLKTYKVVSKTNTRAMKQKKNLVLEFPSKMSTIVEGNTSDDATNENEKKNMNDIQNAPETKSKHTGKLTIKDEKLDKATNVKRKKNVKSVKEKQVKSNTTKPSVNKDKIDEVSNPETPIMRRKRKLYSPKDENVEKKCALRVPETEDDDDDVVLSEFKQQKGPKTKATCYKEIEKERQRHLRAPRNRKSNKIEPSSPRTKKYNNLFDKLKETVEGEKVKLADKTFEVDVYNFTSDSEDEDFKKKTIDIRKNNSAAHSVESTLSKRGRVVKRINYSRNNSSDENKTTKRKNTKRKRTKQKVSLEPITHLVDERMRKAKDVLNTSIIVEKNKPDMVEPDLALDVHPVMEIIEDKFDQTHMHDKKKNVKKRKPQNSDLQKSHSKALDVKPVLDDDRTESPLPGLVVETAPSNQHDPDISASMVDKFKKIYQDGPESYNNESNTTHNLLSDVDRINLSCHNIDNITDDIMQLEEGIQTRFLENKRSNNKMETSTNNNLPSHDTAKNIAQKNVKKNSVKKLKVRSDFSSDDNLQIDYTKNPMRKSQVTKETIIAHIEAVHDPKDRNAESAHKLKRDHQSTRTLNRMATRTTSKAQVTSLKTNTSAVSDSNIEIINVIEMPNEETNINSDVDTDQSVKIKKSSSANKIKITFKKDTTLKPKYDTITEHIIEDISITDVLEIKSERSIGSLGITGHGESEERPPTPRHIEEDIQPRNVGLEDLDLSVKEYFDKLTKELNVSTKSNHSDSKVCTTGVTSPVVSVSRMSPEDISKWLPSRRESTDLDTSTVRLKKHEDLGRSIKSISKNASPVSDKSQIMVKKSEKSLRSISNRRHKNEVCSVSGNNEIVTEFSKKKTKVTMTPKPDRHSKRLSLISPIKLFDDLISECDKKTEKTLSDDEDYMREIKDMYSTKNVLKSLRNRNVSEVKTNVIKCASVSSESSKISTSTRIANQRETLKRISVREKENVKKKKRLEDDNMPQSCGSLKSVSSVCDWLKRNEPTTSSKEAINESFKDTVQNVLEKLDTTLAEVHQNTSKKFVLLFVESQRHLSHLKEQRVTMRKEAGGLLAEFVQVMDQKFADWDKVSQEREEEFMKQLKERAYEIIRDDCKQKRVMMQLLREDVQAVLDHMNTR